MSAPTFTPGDRVRAAAPDNHVGCVLQPGPDRVRQEDRTWVQFDGVSGAYCIRDEALTLVADAPAAVPGTEARIRDAVAVELARARAHNGPMRSAHEGYAVILEEADEFAEEVEPLRHALDYVWAAVRRDDLDGAIAAAEHLEAMAVKAAAEALQTAAMARRFREDLGVWA